MSSESGLVKAELAELYKEQAAEKTRDLERWLNSGSVRIPQPLSYYYFEDRKIDNALKLAKLRPGARILEVGCNLGQQTFVLATMGYAVTGIDLSANAIEKAAMRARHYGLDRVTFEVRDAEDIEGHRDGEFDAAFSFSAFRYFPDPVKALAECYRLVKSGGPVVVDFPNKYCPWFSLLKPAVLMKKHIHDHLFTVRETAAMMERVGFRNIESRVFLFANKELPDRILPVMKLADIVLERTPLVRKMAGIIMVKGEKP
jgi:SAM-dependent methyltransferase